MSKIRYKLYLAGPSVFRPDAYEFGQALARICDEYDFEGIYPIGDKSEMVLDATDPRGNARKIFHVDMRKLVESDAVIADMSPFRGPGMDGGTAFEMGAACMVNKPIVGYGPSLSYRDKVEAWIRPIEPIWRPLPDPATGLVYDHLGMAIDDFGGVDNLMMDQAIQRYAVTFEEALVLMREIFDAKEAEHHKMMSELHAAVGPGVIVGSVMDPDFGNPKVGPSPMTSRRAETVASALDAALALNVRGDGVSS